MIFLENLDFTLVEAAVDLGIQQLELLIQVD
jgi:ABC-type spermidine/putrescine transport system permease subunit I